ncbi:MAG: CDC48 family AAA ATPase [Candidatus ainarchaeum sp.]|nr:CDC48 family AAA ATPase [Candidatus ainarchaeum sp.]
MAEKDFALLKVQEALQGDVGKGIARISDKTMAALGVETGDVVELKGNGGKLAAAIAWRSRAEDEARECVRLDGTLRHNSGSSIDEEVRVRKADVKPAREVRLAPLQDVSFKPDFIPYLQERMLNWPVAQGNSVIIDLMGRALAFAVTHTAPKGVVQVAPGTKLSVSGKPVKEAASVGVRYEDIGGLKEETDAIREMVEIPIKHPEVFKRLGISPPKGVLLKGPPGCGKTLLAKAVASESDAHFAVLNGPEIVSKFYGQSEENLRKVFEEAEGNAPSIVFMDEIDAIAPKREEAGGEAERRIVSQLLTLMDGLEARGDVIVLAATNRADSLDPALRRPGRFDREIEIGVPDRNARREIFQIHTRGMPLAKSVRLSEFVDVTHGFTGADVAALCREAAMRSLRRALPDVRRIGEGVISRDVLERLAIERADFVDALRKVEPSAMREVNVEVPRTHWDDVGGLEDVKEALREAVEWPMKYAETFERIGASPPKGILIAGPPGTGKTLLARAVATESNANFIPVKGPEFLSKWVGESERAVREVFRKARQVSPCILFFDELDSLAPRRGSDRSSGVASRIVDQLLVELDGLEELNRVVVVAATNRLDLVDPGLLRPGRFDRIVFTRLPDRKARKEIFWARTKRMPLAKDVSLDALAEATEGFSGADISAACKDAGLSAIREDKSAREVAMRHFSLALSRIRPSVKGGEAAEWRRRAGAADKGL